MMLICVLAVLLVPTATLDHKQLNGMKNLIKGLPPGVYPTCQIILFSELVDYDTADERCKTFDVTPGTTSHGNLVTVDDYEKNQVMGLLLGLAYPFSDDMHKWGNTSWVWAGLRKTKNTAPKSKKDKTYDLHDWEWADGSHPSGYIRWMRKQPDQNSLKFRNKGCNEKPRCFQNQMRINHKGHWDDTYKFKKHPYACDYRGKYIVSPEKKTWWKAKEACEDAGLILAKVTSRAELDELINIAVYVLGETDEELRVFHPDNWFWIGGNDLNEEAVWRWTDGEDVEDWGIPWRNPMPDNAVYALPAGQNAMSVSKWGQVDDSFELKRKRGFACQCIYENN